jgi:hypothetical protein
VKPLFLMFFMVSTTSSINEIIFNFDIQFSKLFLFVSQNPVVPV